MTVVSEHIKEELATLIEEGVKIYAGEANKQQGNTRSSKQKEKEDTVPPPIFTYQSWYTRALAVVKQLLPDRYQEFVQQYGNEKRKEIDDSTYTISDYLLGLSVTRASGRVVNSFSAFASRFQRQITILNSAQDRINSILADIQGVLQAELFDSELENAIELLKKGHLRAAGAVAGVALESHLARICNNHGVAIRKKDPVISDFNDALKNNGVFDVPNWRFVQRLGDIRNLCVHKKDREPTADEVDELIRGTQKAVKTLF